MLLTGAVQPSSQACSGHVPAAHIIHGPVCQALKAGAACQGLRLLHDGLDALESLPSGGPHVDVHLQAAAHRRGRCVRQVTFTAAVSPDVWSSALQLNIHHQAAAHTRARAMLQTSHCLQQQCHEASGAVGSRNKTSLLYCSCASSILGSHRGIDRPRYASQQALPTMPWSQQLSS